MQLLNQTELGLWTIPWRAAPKRPAITVVVKASCALGDGRVEPCDASPPQGEPNPEADPELDVTLPDGYPSDFALLKPRAEVLVSGHLHPPTVGARAAVARVRFGARLDRSVAGFGDRVWRGGSPSEPAPMAPVPMSYQQAFGGPGFDENPIGRGFGGRAGAPLPNLEDPARLVSSRDHRPPPMCLGAVPMSAPARWARLGTFDASWRDGRWPSFPADFDPTFFQAAPAAQQLDRIRGDEPFDIEGMRPDGERLRGALPGLDPRLYLHRADLIEPLELRLDTVVFDCDAARLHLLYRALLPASAPQLEALELRLGPASDAQLREERLRSEVHEPLPPPSQDRQSLDDERARRLRLEVEQALAAEGSLDGRDLMGADLSALPLAGRSFRGANLVEANLHSANLRGADLSEAMLSRADLRAADVSEAVLCGADLSQARLEGANLGGALLENADLSRCQAKGVSFESTRGAQVLLVDSDLSESRFGCAQLESLDLSGCTLQGARFDGAILPALRMHDARGAGVSFVGADLRNSRAHAIGLPGADLRGIRADDSVWEQADLSQADLRGASLAGLCANDAMLAGAKLSETILRGAQLRRADLRAATLLRADLFEATLEGAQLRAADLRGANLCGAETLDADGSGVRLEGALLHRCKLKERS